MHDVSAQGGGVLSGQRKRAWFRTVVSALLAPGLLGVSAPALADSGSTDQMTNVELAEESIDQILKDIEKKHWGESKGDKGGGKKSA